MRSPALISACSKAGCHAVLASLSGRYPPLEGRSPTRYSPVRHSVSIATNRVRLACVRHAASVDSEPGSNSHVKWAVSPPAPQTACAIGIAGGSQLLTRAPVENGSCVVSYLCSMTPAYFLADVCQGLKLTLDGLPRGFLAEPQNRVQSRCFRASVLFTPDATAAHRTVVVLARTI